MPRKVDILLEQLATLELSSPQAIELTKQIVQAHKEQQKKKEDKAKEPKKPKELKIKQLPPFLCDHCFILLEKQINAITYPKEES